MAKQIGYAALAGVSGATVALGVGELVAVLAGARSAPLVAVGGVVIDNVPESGKELAIRLFGTNDKIALQVGTVILLAGLAAVLGVVALSRLRLGLAGIAAFGVIGGASALTRAGANAAWALPSLLGAGAAGMTLWLLVRYLTRSRETASVAPPSETASVAPPSETASVAPPSETASVVPPSETASVVPPSETASVAPPSETASEVLPGPRRMGGAERRRFLLAAGAAIGGGAILGYAGRTLGQRTSVNTARAAVTLPTPSGRPAVSPAEADIAGLSYVTSNDTFYRIDTALVVPRIDPASWTLTIHGRVRNSMRLTFADLLRLPMIERYVTLACVSNEVGGDLIGNARWLGVPIKDLLDEAEPEDGADQVVSRSVDGFTAGTPTKVLRDGRDAMIAVAMNGEPLPIDHGFPARMVVPGLYGYVSATKWLAELQLTAFADFDAYWIPRGWAQQAPIKTQSRIDRPRAGSTVAAGPVVIAGVAWAQHRGIAAVEVRVGDGAWRRATLAAVASTDTWRLWSLQWDATPGQHTIEVRATDNAGDVQTQDMAPPAPDGATGWHGIGVSVA